MYVQTKLPIKERKYSAPSLYKPSKDNKLTMIYSHLFCVSLTLWPWGEAHNWSSWRSMAERCSDQLASHSGLSTSQHCVVPFCFELLPRAASSLLHTPSWVYCSPQVACHSPIQLSPGWWWMKKLQMDTSSLLPSLPHWSERQCLQWCQMLSCYPLWMPSSSLLPLA